MFAFCLSCFELFLKLRHCWALPGNCFLCITSGDLMKALRCNMLCCRVPPSASPFKWHEADATRQTQCAANLACSQGAVVRSVQVSAGDTAENAPRGLGEDSRLPRTPLSRAARSRRYVCVRADTCESWHRPTRTRTCRALLSFWPRTTESLDLGEQRLEKICVSANVNQVSVI